MIVRLRRQYAQVLTGGGQLVLLLVGFQSESRRVWIACLAGVALLSFFAWIATVRRWRAIGETPTSQVASAAQGYVELAGRARNHPDAQIIAPHSQRPCCWYRYLVERKRSGGKGWNHVDEGESVASFLLVDATGEASIEPDGADVLVKEKHTWTRGDHRYTEWLILEKDPLYALGGFTTRRVAPSARDAHDDVGAMLASWKSDPPALMQRFDLDRDGKLGFEEWMLARAEAKRRVERTHAELRETPAFDVVSRPADGRLYLLSNLDPVRLERKYFYWAWFHLAAFFASLGAMLWLIA